MTEAARLYKLIGADGKEYGPVTPEQLRQWVTEGRVNAQTQVQAEGQTDWTTLSACVEFADLFSADPAAGASITGADAKSPVEFPSAETILARDYQLDIGKCVSRGWQVMTQNAGLLIGGSLVVLLLNGLSGAPANAGRVMVEFGKSNPPLLAVGAVLMLIGYALSAVLAGPLMGGLYWPFIKLMRSQTAEFGDFFAGFRRRFVDLMLGYIVTALLIGLCFLPGVAVFVPGVILYTAQHSAAIGIPLMVAGGILLAVGFVMAFWLGISWVFTLPLIVDRQIGFWDAMKLGSATVRKHWWQVFGLFFVAGLIGLAGILVCCVGLIFSIPLAFAIQMAAYEEIFGACSSFNP